MARGKRTNPTAAILAKVMAEVGFEIGLISEVIGLPRGTVKDIVNGHGAWSQMPQNEAFEAIRVRMKTAIENVADDLAMKVITRLEEKIEKASFMEACSILGALARIGD